MGRSCCGATPSQADTINKFVPKNSETSSRENSCGNGDIQNNDDNNTDSSAKATDTCYQEPTDSCKGKARPAACEGGCCDQSSEAIGEKDVPSLGASTSKEACCAEDSTIKAGMLSPSVSCPGTPWLSKPATSVEPTVAECCQGKPSPCCDETCLDRLALRECDTGSSTHCMEIAGYCMLK